MQLPLLHRTTQMAVLKKLIRKKVRELRRRRLRAQRRLEMMRQIRWELLRLMQRLIDLRQRDVEQKRREQARRAVGGMLHMYQRWLSNWTRAIKEQSRHIRQEVLLKRGLNRRLRLLRKRLRKHHRPQHLVDKVIENLAKAVRKWQRRPDHHQYIKNQELIWAQEIEEVRRYLSDIRGKPPKRRKSPSRTQRLSLDLQHFGSFWKTEVLRKKKKLGKIQVPVTRRESSPEWEVYRIPKPTLRTPRRSEDKPVTSEIYIDLGDLDADQERRRRRRITTQKRSEEDLLGPSLKEIQQLFRQLKDHSSGKHTIGKAHPYKEPKREAPQADLDPDMKRIHDIPKPQIYRKRHGRNQVNFVLRSLLSTVKEAKKFKWPAMTSFRRKVPIRNKYAKKPKSKLVDEKILKQIHALKAKKKKKRIHKAKSSTESDNLWRSSDLSISPSHTFPRAPESKKVVEKFRKEVDALKINNQKGQRPKGSIESENYWQRYDPSMISKWDKNAKTPESKIVDAKTRKEADALKKTEKKGRRRKDLEKSKDSVNSSERRQKKVNTRGKISSGGNESSSDDGTDILLNILKTNRPTRETSISEQLFGRNSVASFSDSLNKLIMESHPPRKSVRKTIILRPVGSEAMEPVKKKPKVKKKHHSENMSDDNQPKEPIKIPQKAVVTAPPPSGKKESKSKDTVKKMESFKSLEGSVIREDSKKEINEINEPKADRELGDRRKSKTGKTTGDPKKDKESGNQDLSYISSEIISPPGPITGDNQHMKKTVSKKKVSKKKDQNIDKNINETDPKIDYKTELQTGHQDVNKISLNLVGFKSKVQGNDQEINKSDQGIKKSDQGINESDQGINKSDHGIIKSDHGIIKSDQGINKSELGIKISSKGADQEAARYEEHEKTRHVKTNKNEMLPRFGSAYEVEVIPEPRKEDAVNKDSTTSSPFYSKFSLKDLESDDKYKQIQLFLKDVIESNPVLDQVPDVQALMKTVGNHYMWGSLRDLYGELLAGGINKQEIKRLLSNKYVNHLRNIRKAQIAELNKAAEAKAQPFKPNHIQNLRFWQRNRLNSRQFAVGIQGIPTVKGEGKPTQKASRPDTMYKKLIGQEMSAERAKKDKWDERLRRLLPTSETSASMSFASTNTTWEVVSEEEEDLRTIDERYSLTNLNKMLSEHEARFEAMERSNGKALHKKLDSKVKPVEKQKPRTSLKKPVRPLDQMYYQPRMTSREQRVIKFYSEYSEDEQDEALEEGTEDSNSCIDKCPKCGVKVVAPCYGPSPKASSAILSSGSIEACAKNELLVNTIADVCTRCGYVHDEGKPCTQSPEDKRRSVLLRMIKAVQAVRSFSQPSKCSESCPCRQIFKWQEKDLRSCTSKLRQVESRVRRCPGADEGGGDR